MFDAVRVLLANGFVQEAAALCRPLFVDSLALAEVAAADETRRISLVVGRQLDAIADIDGIFREMKARGDKSVVRNLKHMAERRRRVEKYARRYDASTRHWKAEDQVKTLADKHDRGDDYTAYRMTSDFVHGSAAITEHRSIGRRGGRGADRRATPRCRRLGRGRQPSSRPTLSPWPAELPARSSATTSSTGSGMCSNGSRTFKEGQAVSRPRETSGRCPRLWNSRPRWAGSRPGRRLDGRTRALRRKLPARRRDHGEAPAPMRRPGRVPRREGTPASNSDPTPAEGPTSKCSRCGRAPVAVSRIGTSATFVAARCR